MKKSRTHTYSSERRIMRNVPSWLKTAAFLCIVFLLVIQVIRIDRSNPAVYSDLDADPSVQSILRKSCYDCHSNETVWPWYSGLAPVSWLVGNDVKEGRRHLNFSEWSTLDERTRLHKKQEIGEEVKAGRMPPWYYLLMHSGSRLKPSEQDLITAWTSSAAEAGAR
jgi:hypothetical protein